MAITLSGSNGVTTPSGYVVNKSGGAYASFGAAMNDTTNIHIMQNVANGRQVPISREFSPSRGINVSTSGNTWTHNFTGHYHVSISFRQNSGGDIWNQFAVTKDGSNNAAGVSARMGSNNSGAMLISFTYQVDSTSSNYQLRGWSLGDTYAGGGPTGNPKWVGDPRVGLYTGHGGSSVGWCYNIIVFRIGDL